MVEKSDLVVSNLIRYFNAQQCLENAKNKLLEIERQVGVKSPNLEAIHGYNGTRDEQLLRFSIEKQKVDAEIVGWTTETNVYYNVLHLFELEENDIKMLEYIYKDKLKYDEIARKMYYTDKSYVSRKKDNILEKLAKYV